LQRWQQNTNLCRNPAFKNLPVFKISHGVRDSSANQQAVIERLPFGQLFAIRRGMQRRMVIFGLSGGPDGVRWPLGRGGIRRLRMSENENVELKVQLERLRQEHRDLDAAIEALQAAPGADVLQVQRLKKRRLVLRDRITFIEDQLTPDIIA
jgi:hypothetical protein